MQEEIKAVFATDEEWEVFKESGDPLDVSENFFHDMNEKGDTKWIFLKSDHNECQSITLTEDPSEKCFEDLFNITVIDTDTNITKILHPQSDNDE